MNRTELAEVTKAYYSSDGLKVDIRDYDIAEKDLTGYQKIAMMSTSGEWKDGV
jgi:hypothetical protein